MYLTLVFLKLFLVKYLRKQAILTGRPATLGQKRFQDFLNIMGLILTSIQRHSTILCLNKKALGL